MTDLNLHMFFWMIRWCWPRPPAVAIRLPLAWMTLLLPLGPPPTWRGLSYLQLFYFTLMESIIYKMNVMFVDFHIAFIFLHPKESQPAWLHFSDAKDTPIFHMKSKRISFLILVIGSILSFCHVLIFYFLSVLLIS